MWNTAVLLAGADPFDLAAAKEVARFGNRRLRTSGDAVHTHADPFLFAHEDSLYLFLEEQRVAQPGRITAYRTHDLSAFESLGVVLDIAPHASYPQVFASDGAIHLLPETHTSGEVALYTFANFPFAPRKHAVLLSGAYDDPTIVRHEGLWWLFVSSVAGLELFYAEEVVGPYARHPVGVITKASDRARCGGAILSRGGCLYRPAQDRSDAFARNLSLMKIDELTPTAYRESAFLPRLFKQHEPWCEFGGHHISLAEFGGRTVIAVDGLQLDYWANRPISLTMTTFANSGLSLRSLMGLFG